MLGKKRGIEKLLFYLSNSKENFFNISLLGPLWHSSFIEENRIIFYQSDGVNILSDLFTKTKDEETIEKIMGTIWVKLFSFYFDFYFYLYSFIFFYF